MIKSFKIRLYPTREQETLMWKHIGCCRYVWNWMLEKQIEAYESGEKYISQFNMIKLLTPLKKDGNHDWLYEVSNHSLQHICTDLNEAYQSFFRKQNGFPKFKSRKKSKTAYPVDTQHLCFKDNKTIFIQKLGIVKYKTDFIFPINEKGLFSNPRITYINHKWILSFGMECENQTPTLTDKPMGIDLGIKDTLTVAYGDEKIVFHNINKGKKIRNLKQKIMHLQRTISRKYEQNKQGNKFVKTNNIVRCEDKLKQLYARLTGIRHNYIHQSTHSLVSRLPNRVVMEDLNVTGMMKNKHLAKYIQEQCFFEWIRQMQYKCEWLGIPFIQADRFYASSKTCSNCGCINKNLKLSDRTFVCPECGFTIDRDYQAALNLQRYEI